MTCRQNHTKVRILERLHKICGKVRERKGRKAAHRDISRGWGPQPTLVALRIDVTWPRLSAWISLCKKRIENQPNVPLKPDCYGSLWEEIEKTLQLNKEGQLGEIISCGGRNRPYLLHLGGGCFCRDHKAREPMQLRRRQQRKCRWKTNLGFFKPYRVYLDPLYLFFHSISSFLICLNFITS